MKGRPRRTRGAAKAFELAELRITLRDITPEIWRIVRGPRRASLLAVHELIQTVFGWDGAHLWAFIDGQGVWYAPPSEEAEHDNKMVDVSDRGLHHLLKKPGDRITYVYDWGDNWKHDITLVRLIKADEPLAAPFFCVAGARAGPHEDTGGPEAHMRYCEILGDPAHSEFEELREWIGEDYDPDVFSARQANQLIRRIRG